MTGSRFLGLLGVVVMGLSIGSAEAAPTQKPTSQAGSFDRDAAASVLSSVNLGKCKKPKAKRGEGHVLVTFAPTGSAKDVVVDRGPFVGTPAAKCIASQFKKQAKVPAFGGDAVLVGKNFRFD